MLSERKAWLIGALLLAPICLSLIIRSAGGLSGASVQELSEIAAVFLFLLYPQIVCTLLGILYATGLINAELENQTLSYLFTRPIAKWRIIVAKYLAMTSVLTIVSWTSLAASWVVWGAPGGGRMLAAQSLALVGSSLAYEAVFVFIGIVAPARAMVIALLYSLVEFGVSFVPAVLNTLAVTYYLRSIVARILDYPIPEPLQRVAGGATVPGSLMALGAMVALALALACFAASHREYIVGKGD